MRVAVIEWAARCPECGTWASSLEPEINARNTHVTTATQIDGTARVAGLESLRRENFRQILNCVDALVPLAGARLLDVGSAHGWFLEEAAARGAQATGVEPDDDVAADPLRRGLDIRCGYFPDVIAESETFDIVTFNDVLEHIPDARATLEACARVLRPGGVLSVNIPNADGLGYRVAGTTARVGIRGPFERFWQHGLPSPHCHYFTRASLARLVTDSGFAVEEIDALSAISRQGLWDRVHTFRQVSPASIASFAALWAAAPVLNRPRNSDIVLMLALRPG
ncbi:MAG TPA: class I SAM-dependent methyltransferase [Solirubrobacterales bacterium]|nr:class I SAM-dependent methyltransferase [Solirubrobacterales bacterium]